LINFIQDLLRWHEPNFLTQWGIDNLVSEANAYWEKLKHAPDVAAMKMRRRSTEVSMLDYNAGLGATVCVQFIAER